MRVTETTEVEVGEKTSLMRKHGGVDFPLFCLAVSANAVMKEWAVRPWSPDGEEDRGRKPPHAPFVLFRATSKTHLSAFCQRPQSVETLLAAVYTPAEERKSKEKNDCK